ncbi:MAG: MGMT family protein [Streptomyces sp.]|nr:MGMT family protein [Streptomyces sp.]
MELPLDWTLTSGAQQAVLRTLQQTVGFGRTITYGELAERSGAFEAAGPEQRALGPAVEGGALLPTPGTAPRRVVASPKYAQYEDDAPPCEAPHQTPLAAGRPLRRQTLAARTVGSIMGSNPISLLVPCHRVVAADGIGGFGGGETGLALKRWLLTLEGCLAPTLDWAGPS